MKNTSAFSIVVRFLPFLLFGIALYIVHRELQNHQFAELTAAWRTISWYVFVTALISTLISYTVLAGTDWLGLVFTGHLSVPFRHVLFTSFVSYGISNNTGHAWASGGSVRYRFYNTFNVPGWDVAKISVFLSLTYVLGVLTLGLVGGLLFPDDVRNQLKNPHLIQILPLICGAALSVYGIAVLCWRKSFYIQDVEMRLPSPRLTVAQIAMSVLDLVFASLVLWVFLKDIPGFSFETFVVMYVTAQALGLISQVPGGIGVFEGAFLWLAGAIVGPHNAALVAGLIFYRAIYYFLPLALAGVLLIGKDIVDQRERLLKIGQSATRLIPSSAPQIFSILLFLTGGVLLISGATPTLPENLHWLRRIVPLPLVEFSHLTGSLIGVLLLFLARGIRLKLDAAWYGALILLAAGMVASILKGLDGLEASILGIMFVMMYLSHSHFYRKSSLFTISLDPMWLFMIFAMVSATTWLGFFSYKHVEYSNDLWWQFSYHGDASRFLRSLIIVTATAFILLARYFFAVYHPKNATTVSSDDLAKALPIVQQGDDTQNFLALLGDKALFWSDDELAFLAYVPTQRYWVVMGDPIGERKSFESLLWRFREEADRYGAKIVLYQVGEDHLPLYLDLGLILLKLGQEALVPLPDFSLSGRKRDNLRRGYNKIVKANYRFKILEQAEVEASIDRIREISDAWLSHKKAREKGFSLGFFAESYLLRTRIAVVLDEAGRIMAFANLWETTNKSELSVDLMRYDPASAKGVMDFLFAELMLWGRDQGYQWFNLGMAPLSGLERHPLAPLWHKIGTTIYDLGEEFYNFEGLYDYKAKFEPEWHSRYLAAPAGLSAPFILITIARLISGGFRAALRNET